MVKVQFIKVEGTADEILRVAHLFQGDSDAPKGTSTAPEQVGAGDLPPTVTPDLVKEVLTRRELGENPKKVLKSLLAAGPKGLTSSEIAKNVGIDRGQLAGVFGAFGRRLAGTPSWPSGAGFLTETRDENNVRRYQLTPVVRETLASGIVRI